MKQYTKVNLSPSLLFRSYFLVLMFLSLVAEAQFVGSVQPQSFFPATGGPYPIPTSTTGRPLWPTFYNQRNNGSCYNATMDLGGPAGDEHIYVWAINWEDVAGHSVVVAYEVTDAGGTTIHRGTHYVGADIANLNVGIVQGNGGHVAHIITSYWEAGSTPTGNMGVIRMDDFLLNLGTGLSLLGTYDLYYMLNTTHEAMHVSMDCHDLEAVSVVWEDVGNGIFVEAIDFSGGPGFSGVLSLGHPAGRIPDVAMSHRFGGSFPDRRDIHIAFAETGMNQIEKYLLDYDNLMLSGPGATVTFEDMTPFSGFGPYWDDFMLKIDAPDHYTAANSDWSYAYFSDNNNEINVRMCNRLASPVINTYTVNNASVEVGYVGSGIYLPDLTTAGNAFPTITYHTGGASVYVGWYTNYDPVTTGGAFNPLYTYTAETQGYISVLLDKGGFIRSPAYNRVDNDYLSNRIGTFIDPANPWTDYNYPKICFSKHNDGDRMFTLFASHMAKPGLLWSVPSCSGPSIQSIYHEADPGLYPPLCTFNHMVNGLNYAIGGLSSGPSVFLSQKYGDWYSYPLFRTTKEENTIEAATTLSVASNPFTAQRMFRLKGGDEKEIYTATLNGIDGKRLLEYSGTLSELNEQFKQPGISLASGIYQLHVKNSRTVEDFKLVKE